MKPTAQKLVDFALLQVGWFACVLGGAQGNGWVGPLTVVVFVAIHLLWVVPDPLRRLELRNILVLGLVGCLIDVLQVRAGALCFADSAWKVAGIPPWLAGLWFLFPILFNTAFEWLRGRPWLAAGLALVGAPLSYRAGAALGALELGSDEVLALASLGVAWAIYLPLALRFAAPDEREEPGAL